MRKYAITEETKFPMNLVGALVFFISCALISATILHYVGRIQDENIRQQAIEIHNRTGALAPEKPYINEMAKRLQKKKTTLVPTDEPDTWYAAK